MAQTECGRGHVYDSDIYSKCPYCNGERKSIVFGGKEASSDIGKTVACNSSGEISDLVTHIGPNDEGGSIPPTVAAETGTVAPGDKKNPTVWIDRGGSGVRATVGWIVSIEGPEKGKDFRLHAGNNNSIGRSEKMDVCIAKDKAVSSEYQARIAYDEKHNRFDFIPGEKAENNNYVNGNAVYGPVKLEAYDEIEFGESKFLFVPFCNDRFVWSKGKQADDAR